MRNIKRKEYKEKGINRVNAFTNDKLQWERADMYTKHFQSAINQEFITKV